MRTLKKFIPKCESLEKLLPLDGAAISTGPMPTLQVVPPDIINVDPLLQPTYQINLDITQVTNISTLLNPPDAYQFSPLVAPTLIAPTTVDPTLVCPPLSDTDFSRYLPVTQPIQPSNPWPTPPPLTTAPNFLYTQVISPIVNLASDYINWLGDNINYVEPAQSLQ